MARNGSSVKVVQNLQVPFSWSPPWPVKDLMAFIWPYIASYMALGAFWSLIEPYKGLTDDHLGPISINQSREKLPRTIGNQGQTS